MKGLVPKSECKKVIHYFDSHRELHCEGFVGNAQINYKEKKDTEISCDFTKPDGPCWISKYVDIALDEYIRQYPEANWMAKYHKCPNFKLQRYFPSEGYFVYHFENDGPNVSNRVLAWMIYLNDVSDGGHTEFPSQKKKYQPRMGDVLLWPAHFTHPHRGITSKSQTKYIATGWFSFKL
jgi:hypothetical protein